MMKIENKTFNLKPLWTTVAGILLSSGSGLGHTISLPGSLAKSPLFVQQAVKHNLMLAIDDSGSMDFEVLLPTNDGALWWSNSDKSFVGVDAPGIINFQENRKYVYLFPNGQGVGTGQRRYGVANNHFAIPPLPQYAFTRSPDYNKAYYDPSVTYDPWVSYGSTTFSNISATIAPSDPVHGSTTFNLTTDILSTASDHTFRMYNGMTITKGTRYNSSGAWLTATSDISVNSTKNVGIRYYAPTYYLNTKTGVYSLNNSVTTKDCSNTPNPADYITFRNNPGAFTSSDVDALGPDGACLKKYTIVPAATEMQNFSNWFTYYRKRKSAMRGGVGYAFENISGIRAGMFTINQRVNVNMLDLDTQRNAFYASIYNIDASGGTPNRQALNHAGLQYMRTDNNAPITDRCQKCFTVFFTDGFSSLGGIGGLGINNQDGSKGAPYADTYSNTMGDIAMHYFNLNLRPDIPNQDVKIPNACSGSTPSPLLDCNKNLHMNTYTIGLNATGTIYNVTHNTTADAHASPPVWPDVNSARDPKQIDDLYHAAINGRGEMLNATTPQGIAAAMLAAIDDIQSKTESAAPVSFNTTTLRAGSLVFQSSFDAADWTGELNAISLALDTTGKISGLTQEWSATTGSALTTDSKGLDERSYASRKIVTHNGTNGVDFTWGNLTNSQKNDLRAGSGITDAQAKARLEYIRGHQGCETTYSGSQSCSFTDGSNTFNSKSLRDRGSLLGDIVHSSPTFVGAPATQYPDNIEGANLYSTYANSKKNRRGVVYVGANDGMLHAFDADNNGQEIFAYIPSMLFSNDSGKGLHTLTDPNYTHNYYVDLTATAADVFVGGSWKTYLVGGLRGGGRGIFALDVTNPTSLASNPQNAIKWEYSSSDSTFADLGYSFSKIQIGRMNNGKWAAILGNGYNNQGDGSAKLFIVYLDGSTPKILSTGVGTLTNLNGLSTPEIIDLNGDGSIDRIYAGDLHGNMWAFDVTGTESSWSKSYGSSPLFRACADAGCINPQPITSKPSVSRHPVKRENATTPNLMVYFGTGQYIATTDNGTSEQQTFYGIWDSGSTVSSRSVLQPQVMTTSAYRTISDDPVNYSTPVSSSTKYGWYIDLDSTERVTVDPLAIGDVVFFNTLLPPTSTCGYGGSGWLMVVDQLNGGEPAFPTVDTNGDGVVDIDDTLAGGTVIAGVKSGDIPSDVTILPNYRFDNNPASGTAINAIGSTPSGRMSWTGLERK